jgi:N-acetylmuramoyl-L-alanine amidase
MTITPDHWLAEAIRRPIPGGIGMPSRRFLVMHFTAGASAQSSIDFWNTPAAKGASAHIVIDRDGTIYQCRPFNRTAGHAGKSAWREPRTGTRHNVLNSCSRVIDIDNGGDAYPTRFSNGLAPTHARHKNGGPETDWETYPAAQLTACEALIKALVARYKLDDVAGHEDIAPHRKTDPGPAFPMTALRAACGFLTPLP